MGRKVKRKPGKGKAVVDKNNKKSLSSEDCVDAKTWLADMLAGSAESAGLIEKPSDEKVAMNMPKLKTSSIAPPTLTRRPQTELDSVHCSQAQDTSHGQLV